MLARTAVEGGSSGQAVGGVAGDDAMSAEMTAACQKWLAEQPALTYGSKPTRTCACRPRRGHADSFVYDVQVWAVYVMRVLVPRSPWSRGAPGHRHARNLRLRQLAGNACDLPMF